MSMAPAGWYDDGQAPGQERFWDGAQWTGQFRPVAPVAPVAPAAPVVAVAPVQAVAPVSVAPYGYPAATSGYPAAAAGYPPSVAAAHPYGSPPAKRKMSVWAWLAPLIVVFLALVGAAIWLLVSLLGGSTSGPAETVTKWGTAMAELDCPAIFSTTTAAARAELGIPGGDLEGCVAAASSQTPVEGGVHMVISSVNVVNATATVDAVFTVSGEARAIEFGLVNQGGVWLIDSAEFSEDSGTPDPSAAVEGGAAIGIESGAVAEAGRLAPIGG